jgi:O-methyltransferase
VLLKNAYIQRYIGGGRLERMGIRLLSTFEYMILGGHKDPEVLRLIRRTRRERRTLVTFNEAYNVYSMCRSLESLPGEIAEIGVYEGSTARLLCELKGIKSVHLFDTFEGLPEGTTATEKIVYGKKTAQYRCSLESVQGYLKTFDNVNYYRGFFPKSAEGLDPNLRFAFVHMDVDLYQSTLDCLKFFYDRMVPGGIMLTHDYSILEGVGNAFREFLVDKSERIIELPTTQAMIIKR